MTPMIQKRRLQGATNIRGSSVLVITDAGDTAGHSSMIAMLTWTTMTQAQARKREAAPVFRSSKREAARGRVVHQTHRTPNEGGVSSPP